MYKNNIYKTKIRQKSTKHQNQKKLKPKLKAEPSLKHILYFLL